MKPDPWTFPGNISPLPDAAKFFSTHKPNLPKPLVAELVKFNQEQIDAVGWRSQFTPENALIAFREIATRAAQDPTPENLAALTRETQESLVAKYRENNESCAALQRGLVLKTHNTMVQVLGVLLPIVEDEMDKIAAENRASHERNGLEYVFQDDGELRSLAKLHANLSTRLNNPMSPMRVEELVAILGSLKR